MSAGVPCYFLRMHTTITVREKRHVKTSVTSIHAEGLIGRFDEAWSVAGPGRLRGSERFP